MRLAWLETSARDGGSLAVKLFAILTCGLLLLQGLSYGLVSASLERVTRDKMFSFMVADIAFVRAALLPMDDRERRAFLDKLDRGFYDLAIVGGRPRTTVPEGRLPGLDRVEQDLRRRTNDANIDWVWRQTTVGRVPVLRMPIGRGQFLEVDARDPLPRLSTSAMVAYMAALFILIASLAWLAINLALRPLKRFSAAALALGANLRTPLDVSSEPVEVREAAVALNSMRAQIVRKIEEHTEMLAAVSHDLQTPLTRMRLRADLVEDVANRTKIVRDLDFMSALVAQTVEYGRSAQFNDHVVTIDLDALIAVLTEEITDTGGAVTVSGTIGVPVRGSVRGLQRTFQNLVGNAIKYGGRADIDTGRADGMAVVRIRDQGPGIPPDQIDAVRQPFFRVDAARGSDSGGAGLGLAIADNIVTAHEGTMTLRNTDPGFEVIVCLPCLDHPH